EGAPHPGRPRLHLRGGGQPRPRHHRGDHRPDVADVRRLRRGHADGADQHPGHHPGADRARLAAGERRRWDGRERGGDPLMQQLLASYLLNAAWQVPIVALCAFAIARFAGLEPRARNRLWLGFLAVAAILPALPVAALLPHAAPTVTRVPADAPVDAVALAAAPHAAPSLAPAVALAPWAAWAMT